MTDLESDEEDEEMLESSIEENPEEEQ